MRIRLTVDRVTVFDFRFLEPRGTRTHHEDQEVVDVLSEADGLPFGFQLDEGWEGDDDE